MLLKGCGTPGRGRPPYTVSQAGEANVNGAYWPYSGFDDVPSFKHASHAIYLYRYTYPPVPPAVGLSFWAIGPTHGGDMDGAYYAIGSSADTPPAGTYSDDGVGALPDAVVA